MASGIAHDLNQSLQLIAAHNDLARQQLDQAAPDLDEVRELCTVAAQAALDAGEAVKRLLLFTRGAPDDTPQRVDLVTIAAEVARLTAPRWRDLAQAQGRAIELKLELTDRPVVLAPTTQLRDALTNLVFNAIDALPHGGAIRLRVEQRDGLAWIEVADTGVGMPPEVQARVFEPFFTTKGEGGTGLGLAIVFGVVERCGGRLTIDSAPGQGTTIRLSLPLAPELPQAAPPPPRSPSERAGGPALRVLAVDDEPAITRAVQRILRPAGHLVRCAASGEQALEELATAPFDVVVSDLGMGTGMTGWDLAARVRADWPAVRFILATGWGAGISQAEAEAKGVERVLAKPYRPDDLLQALAAPATTSV
jgi:CheY-like chemotaxis protein